MNVLKYNDYQSEDADFLLSALTFGVANELMYLDENSQVRFKIIDARTCFGIFDNSLTNDLLYFVRMYKADEWDESDNYKVDVYSDNTITHYNMTGQNGNLIFAGEENHYFSQCPANIFYLQDEKAIFECIESLQDAVNELLSCEVDDYSAFCDAYLTLTGGDAEAEDIAQMKENRVLVLPEGASAAWLTKSSNDT
nr:MAG TPA: PORTAL PROTEIN [Caudoviricetes sp.]